MTNHASAADVSVLADALISALDRVRALDRALDRALALDRVRASALDHASILGFTFAFGLASAIGLAVAPVPAIAFALGTGFVLFFIYGPVKDKDRALVLGFDRALVLDRESVLALAEAIVRLRARVGDRALIRALDDTHDHVEDLLDLLDVHDIVATLRHQAERTVSGSSRRLVKLSVRLLPVGDRARYGEEFQVELFELRTEPRWRQFIYSVRQLVRVVWLRRELRRSVGERSL